MTNSNDSSNNYGNWQSKITSDLIVSDSVSLDEPILSKNSLYYIERRPQEKGRCVIVKITDGIHIDLLPPPYSARSRVHEYGGGCYCIADLDNQSVSIYFINDADQDIYSIKNGKINQITRSQNTRFADFTYDKKYRRLIAVSETHNKNIDDSDSQIINKIVSVDIASGDVTTLSAGDDFYASPRLNSTSTQLCWQSWNHPNMPWDGNHLWIAEIDTNGRIADTKKIAGSKSVATFQPQWSPDNILYFISDKTDWWHLYRYLPESISNASQKEIQQLTFGEKEFGLPQWVFAQSTYTFVNKHTIVCQFQLDNTPYLAMLTLKSIDKKPILSVIDNNWHEFSNIHSYKSKLCFIAASSISFPQLVTSTLVAKEMKTKNQNVKLLSNIEKTTNHLPVSQNYYSTAQKINFNNRHNKTVYANYYPPINPDYTSSSKLPPPLIVICHGGPTGQSSTALDPKKQFWTSRGFALLDVNYSGSTGYGKKYRLRLNNNWGISDVEDCCDAALYAVKQGLARQEQLIIRGSSAGGYTVLAALTFEDIFSAGASYYGISELTSLANDTHKFESRYLDRLIGPYPKDKKTYLERSPINHTEKLNCPVIFFQGLEDRVVPKEQAEMMYAALKKKGLPVAAQYFEGEQHGFRKAETVVQTLENELRFYQKVFSLNKNQLSENNSDENGDNNFLGDITTSNI